MANPRSMAQHRERMLAQKAVKLAQNPDPRAKQRVIAGADPALDDGTVANDSSPATVTQRIELRLSNQLDQLEHVRGIDLKIAKKREWYQEYLGFIEGSIAVSPAQQNDALMHLMVWAIDVGDYANAVKIGQFAVLNNMVLPVNYKRGVAELLTEDCAEAFLADPVLAQQSLDIIQHIIDVGYGQDMVVQARAKIFKAQGLALMDSQPAEALNALKTALHLHDKAGVKKDIDKLERLLKRQVTESSLDKPSGSQDVTTAASAGDVIDPASTASTTTDPAATDLESAETSADVGSDAGE